MIVAIHHVRTIYSVRDIVIIIVSRILNPSARATVLAQYSNQEVLVSVPHKCAVETEHLPLRGSIVTEIGRINHFHETVSGIWHNGTVVKDGIRHIGQIDSDIILVVANNIIGGTESQRRDATLKPCEVCRVDNGLRIAVRGLVRTDRHNGVGTGV